MKILLTTTTAVLLLALGTYDIAAKPRPVGHYGLCVFSHSCR